MSSLEPPGKRARPSVNVFYIIPDQRGHYTVRDEYHLHGGYFIDRNQARKYALFENGSRPELIIELPPAISQFFREAAIVSEVILASGVQNRRKAA